MGTLTKLFCPWSSISPLISTGASGSALSRPAVATPRNTTIGNRSASSTSSMCASRLLSPEWNDARGARTSAITLPSSLATAFPSISLLSPSTPWREWSTRNRMELAFGSTESVLGPSRGMERSNKASMGSIQVSLEDERAEADGQGGKGEVADHRVDLAQVFLVEPAFASRRRHPQYRLGRHARGRAGHAPLVQGHAVEALGDPVGRGRSEDRQRAGCHKGADGCPRQGAVGALVTAVRCAADEVIVVVELADDGGPEVDGKQPEAERLVPDEHPAPQRQAAVLGRNLLLRGQNGRNIEVEVRVVSARLLGQREHERRGPFRRSPGRRRQQQQRKDKP